MRRVVSWEADANSLKMMNDLAWIWQGASNVTRFLSLRNLSAWFGGRGTDHQDFVS